jgi:hypothetical protein
MVEPLLEQGFHRLDHERNAPESKGSVDFGFTPEVAHERDAEDMGSVRGNVYEYEAVGQSI